MMYFYVLTDLPSTNKLVSTNQWANETYSRSSLPDVSKLNRAVMNKKQGDQTQFSV